MSVRIGILGYGNLGKGVECAVKEANDMELVAVFTRRNPDKNLKLVLIGGGDINIPEDIKDKVVDLGFLDIQDKYDACAGSVCLCQPSKNESFSIVIMESWLCERPVLVNAASLKSLIQDYILMIILNLKDVLIIIWTIL